MEIEFRNSIVRSDRVNGIFYRHVTSTSKKPTLMLLMGYSGSSDSWGPRFLQMMAERFDLVLVDNRGTGRSDKIPPESRVSVASFADDAHAVVKSIGIPMIVLGMSLGGCIAQLLAHKAKDLVRGLILVSTTAGGSLYFPPKEEMLIKLSSPEGESILEKSMSLWKLCMAEKSIQDEFLELEKIHFLQLNNLTPRSTFKSQMIAFRQFENTNSTAISTLIITGSDDRLMPPENSAIMVELFSNVRTKILEGVEHMPHIERPAQMLAEVLLFEETL